VRRDVGSSQSVTSQDIDRPSHCRISKTEILRGHDAFGKIISAHNRLQVRFLRCFFRIENQIPPYTCMVGFAVKKARSSVQRNKARRLLRESWRLRKGRFEALCTQREKQLRCVFILDVTRTLEGFDFKLVDTLMNKIVQELESCVELS